MIAALAINSAPQWYAVHTLAQKEMLADLSLTRKGFETFCPYRRSWEPSAKSKLLSDLCKIPALPRYLFVLAKPGDIAEVNATMGVATVVYAPGGEPFPIPEQVMAKLRRRLTEKANGSLRRSKFEGIVGQQFRFGEASAFFGLYAVITEILDNDKIVATLTEYMFGSSGREIEAETDDVGELLPIVSNNRGSA